MLKCTYEASRFGTWKFAPAAAAAADGGADDDDADDDQVNPITSELLRNAWDARNKLAEFAPSRSALGRRVALAWQSLQFFTRRGMPF